jgi:uncharacterized protein
MRVAVLGASSNPERYSNKAVRMLKEHGHAPIPVHPVLKKVEGIPVINKLDQVSDYDTLTLYVSPTAQEKLYDLILNTTAQRVIFNPGTENPPLQQALQDKGKEVVTGCTLVMLKTNQF